MSASSANARALVDKAFGQIDEEVQELREVLSECLYPITRRKILKPVAVKGLWWMEENQWIRFLWRGHLGTVLKSGEDPDRVLSTRMFEIGSCYVRMQDDRVDIEGVSRTTKLSRSNGRWKTDSFRGKKTLREWLTVSVTLDEFDRIQEFMGPELDVCNHKDK